MDWQAQCGIKKIVQEDGYGCGAACLAMVSGITYAQARQQFVELGLGVRRSGRPPFSTSSSEMRMAIANAGLLLAPRRWRGWSHFEGLGVLKVRDDWRGAIGRWHWVVAFRHQVYGVTIFDPHSHFPTFSNIPPEELCMQFEIYEPKGEWLQVEQKFALSLPSVEPVQ